MDQANWGYILTSNYPGDMRLRASGSRGDFFSGSLYEGMGQDL